MSVEEYLAFEQSSDARHEFVDGDVFAMSGESRAHNAIAVNIVSRLHDALRSGPCRTFVGSLRLRLEHRYYYPDVMVVCAPAPEDTHEEREPALIVEVLSPSTAETDRGRKLTDYRTILSLRDYVIVSQAERHVVHHSRDDGGEWREVVIADSGIVPLRALGIGLDLGEIYEKVRVPPPGLRLREGNVEYDAP